MRKIEMTQKLISSIPKPDNKGYVLCDNWYNCKAIFNSSVEAGYSYISALKTNRVIYPEGYNRLGIILIANCILMNLIILTLDLS